MASESTASNQLAGDGKGHCSRSHWLSVIGLAEGAARMEQEWWPDETQIAVREVMRSARKLRRLLRLLPCTCSNCQRRPRRSDDKNPHEGTVMQ